MKTKLKEPCLFQIDNEWLYHRSSPNDCNNYVSRVSDSVSLNEFSEHIYDSQISACSDLRV